MITSAPRSCVPTDLALKHTYDYRAIYVDPRLIERSLNVGHWAVLDGQPVEQRLLRLRRWLRLGGGWKHLQRHLSRNVHGRFIAPGDWDHQYAPFTIRATVRDLFVNGLDARDTAEYKKLRDWIVAGEFAWTRGCRTIDDVDRYFEELIELYDAIRIGGYRTQLELGNDGADEIRVCIDRDGRLCIFGGGTHRLSIARLLGLSSVPVVIKRVHPRWVERCRSVYGTSDVQEAVARGIATLQVEALEPRAP